MFPDSFHISKPIRLCQLLHLQNIIASGSSGLQKWNWCRLLFSPNQHQPLFLGILRNQYVPSKFLIHSNLLPISLQYYIHIEWPQDNRLIILRWRIKKKNIFFLSSFFLAKYVSKKETVLVGEINFATVTIDVLGRVFGSLIILIQVF